MKRIVLRVASFVIAAGLVLGLYLMWAKSTFASKEIMKRTGAKSVHILEKLSAPDHWYAKAEIDEQTGRELLGRYTWERDFVKQSALAGGGVPDQPADCHSCFFRVEVDQHDRQRHPYDFRVYILSHDLRVLEVYEQFGS